MDQKDRPLYLPERDLEKLSSFQLTSETGIRKLLDSLLSISGLISLYSDNDVNLFVISRLLEVSDTTLCFDLNTDRERTTFLEKQDAVTVVGFIDQVKVQFSAPIQQIETSDGATRLLCRFPDVMYRIQRRDAYRVRPPIGEPAQVVLRGTPERSLDILDLSATGVSFRLIENELSIKVGDTVEHARLEVGPQVPIPVSFIVRSIFQMKGTQAGHDSYRIGAEFHRLPGPVSRRLQVYVLDVERANRRLRDIDIA
ncbi:MAG: flagellar regulator YcgR PilZN domain-containing protein [Burkholderiaceae bacterium]